ncbi:MAG: ketopantoate reductase family protein [Acidobacteria bacterium]|nr:ketopantoate reductase family protein [Acidobacteriota bacterium]MBI3664451.1 ketopantoate reductase family protein [Acidobacteriota bacterium]
MPDPSNSWPRVTVLGAGAVGCYFGGMLARAGASVTLIGRPEHVDAINRDGLFMDSIHFQERVTVAAATGPAAARDAEIVLFCVKTLNIDDSARSLVAHLSPGAIVVSLQNGVDNIERIRAASSISALPSVVYVAAAMSGPGRIKHSGRGDLVLGRSLRNDAAQRVAECFTRAGVPCRISENIDGDLWAKLVWNCAGNAITALGRASYGQVARNELALQVFLEAASETMSVARAAGITLPPVDLANASVKLARDLGNATSSTAQDIQRGKRTEIDSLNGYVVRRGAELGIPTPVNSTLTALVKLLEDSSR